MAVDVVCVCIECVYENERLSNRESERTRNGNCEHVCKVLNAFVLFYIIQTLPVMRRKIFHNLYLATFFIARKVNHIHNYKCVRKHTMKNVYNAG